MDEIIVQVCRTIACHSRLQILSLLAHHSEISPTDLASHLKIAQPKIADHVRRLSAAGLIQRRHAGVRCYCVAKSPYGPTTVSGRLSQWLFRILRAGAGDAADDSSNRGVDSSSLKSTREQIFHAATAFTHLRRVRILRHLLAHGESDSATLTAQLKMSPSALSRHCDKLVRRGVIVSKATEEGWSCRLAEKSTTRIHQEFIEIVCDFAGKQ